MGCLLGRPALDCGPDVVLDVEGVDGEMETDITADHRVPRRQNGPPDNETPALTTETASTTS